MEHQSLCSAMGIPHSTQTRTRCVGAGALDEKSRLRNDIPKLQSSVTSRVHTQPAALELHGSEIGNAGHSLDGWMPKRVGKPMTSGRGVVSAYSVV